MRQRRDGDPADAGLSLVELLVAMAISCVLLAAIATTFVTSLRISNGVTARTNATADARLAMDTAARRLRVAVRPPGATSMLVSAAPNAISFYASIAYNGDTSEVAPTLVEYSVDATSGCFREALTPATTTLTAGVTTLSWPVASRRTRCLVPGRINAGGAALFTYYQSATGTTPLPPTAGVLPTASLDLVRSVVLTADLRDRATSTVKPTHVETSVTLVNRLDEDLSGRTA